MNLPVLLQPAQVSQGARPCPPRTNDRTAEDTLLDDEPMDSVIPESGTGPQPESGPTEEEVRDTVETDTLAVDRNEDRGAAGTGTDAEPDGAPVSRSEERRVGKECRL